MMSTLHRNFSLVGFSFTVPAIAVIWAVVTPGAMSGTTPIILAILATAMTAVILKAWGSAQPTAHMTHELRPVEAGARRVSVRRPRERRSTPERLYR